MAKSLTRGNGTGEYTDKDIQELPFPENVRTRPNMYVGDPEIDGNFNCFREIFDNCEDEYLAGHCNVINVVRYGPFHFRITDNGRGVPFGVNEKKENTLLVSFGRLHAGRNFNKVKTNYSCGFNGVGASCVNALSEKFTVTSTREGQVGIIAFERGIKKALNITEGGKKNQHGTAVEFKLDETLFPVDIDEEQLLWLFRERASLSPGLKITYKSDTYDGILEFEYEHGTEAYLKELFGDKLLIKPACFQEKVDDVVIDISFGYINGYEEEEIYSYVNTIRTTEGGTHVTGFKRALSQVMTKHFREAGLVKQEIDSSDFQEGLVAIVSAYVMNPKYSSQTKQKLQNTEVNGHAFKVAANAMKEWIDKNPKDVKILANKIATAAAGRLARKAAQEKVRKEAATGGSIFSSLNNPKKFSDCLNDAGDSDNCELFIVEGKELLSLNPFNCWKSLRALNTPTANRVTISRIG